MIKINEIFHSIQGESTYAGLPCVFVRLTYCNLRCSYCDTEYSFHEGKDYSIDQIIEKVKSYNCKLVEVTGGEPLFQNECYELLQRLCDEGLKVLLETGGSLSVKEVDSRVKIIMDLKTPSSKMEKKNMYENINYIKKGDEIKFVIGDYDDYVWSKEICKRYSLIKNFTVLFSTVFDQLSNEKLSNWILKDKLDVRFQLQMHKYIWEPDKRGV